jgi:hypothetical protein
MSKKEEVDLRFNHIYKEEGKCPKCGHRLFTEGQVSACPPCERCPICGFHRFDQRMDYVDFDLLQTMGK